MNVSKKDLNTIISETCSFILENQKLNSVETPNRINVTKTLLHKYPDIKALKEIKQREIDKLSNEVGEVAFSSASVISFSTGDKINTSETIMQNQALKNLATDISVLDYYIQQIDNALRLVKDDKYYAIIELKYFQDKTNPEIAEDFGCDVKTIGRNGRKLIEIISAYLFTKEYVTDLLTIN